MTITVELAKNNDGRSLIAKITDGKLDEFVVCSGYHAYAPLGLQWYWGSYYNDLKQAMEELNRQ